MFFEGRIFFLTVCLKKRYTKVLEVVFMISLQNYQGKLTTLLEPLHTRHTAWDDFVIFRQSSYLPTTQQSSCRRSICIACIQGFIAVIFHKGHCRFTISFNTDKLFQNERVSLSDTRSAAALHYRCFRNMHFEAADSSARKLKQTERKNGGGDGGSIQERKMQSWKRQKMSKVKQLVQCAAQ